MKLTFFENSDFPPFNQNPSIISFWWASVFVGSLDVTWLTSWNWTSSPNKTTPLMKVSLRSICHDTTLMAEIRRSLTSWGRLVVEFFPILYGVSPAPMARWWWTFHRPTFSAWNRISKPSKVGKVSNTGLTAKLLERITWWDDGGMIDGKVLVGFWWPLEFPGLRVCWFMIPKMDKPKKHGKGWFVST